MRSVAVAATALIDAGPVDALLLIAYPLIAATETREAAMPSRAGDYVNFEGLCVNASSSPSPRPPSAPGPRALTAAAP